MKNINKKIPKILFISFMAILSSCEKDLYEESIINKSKVTSQKVSINEVFSEINNPLLKNYISNELNQQIGISELRTNFEDYLSFIKIIKENEYVTYSLLINKYSESQPYEKYFVITKDGATEKAGYSKYIPNEPIIDFNPYNFTGKIQVIDLQNEVKSETPFINSIAQPQTQSFTCTNSVDVITHNCSNGGNHPPGTSCSNNNVNDAYWEIVTTVTCIYNNNFNYIAPPTAFMSDPSGGGSPATFDPKVLAFIYSLTDEEYNAIKDMPEVLTYLEENESSIESQNFIRDIIYRILDNPGIFKSIKPFLIEKKIDDSLLDPCTKTVVEELKNIHEFDIAKIIAKFGDPSTDYNVKIIPDVNLSQDVLASTDWSAPIGSPIVPYEYTIKLNTQYLQGATTLSIASTIIHEMIHVYFLSLVDDYEMGDINNIQTFPILWNDYVNNVTGGVGNIVQHNQMAALYLDTIARALQEYHTGIQIPIDQQPQQLYKDLAWGGLAETPPYNALSPEEKNRIIAINYAENHNISQTANGVNYTPVSTPCN